MDDMDMGDMSMGMFTEENQYRAKILWYLIATWVGLLTILRICHSVLNTRTRPNNKLSQFMATTTAIYREFAYPQPLWFTGKLSKYFTPPPIGRMALLGCYWIVILTLMWSDVLLSPDDPMYPYYWEKVGFRAAWISVTQIPFVYLLSCKLNPISMLTGISYERFNWLHRWVARTVFVTIIFHWSYFFSEWWLADFVDLELDMMPMVKYGFGAWAVVGWMLITGFGFFRAISYELFVAQHILAAAVLLWLIFVHVPKYAMYNVWLSIGFVAFDWGVRLLLAVWRNTHFGSLRLPGYSARLETLPGELTRLTIDDIDFTWRAGQHIYLSIPALRPLELHPFTISNTCAEGKLTLLIKAHSGFSRSLHKSGKDVHRVFLNGPFGIPPDVSRQDTVVLVACSTGVSFTLPILQDLLAKKAGIRRIYFHWIVRQEEHVNCLDEALTKAAEVAGQINLNICIHVTSGDNKTIIAEKSEVSSISASSDKPKPLMQVDTAMSQDSASGKNLRWSGRPQLDTIIRPAVEGALGETAVVACGGLAFTAEIRTYVALLSDERAVHKGTGAQGIFLFTETYGWG